MSSLIVYGVPLSPPFRSVVWALLQKHQPFKIQLIIPGATTRIGSLNESFLAKTRGRTGVVPVLEDGSTAITLSESPAILAYLCETRAALADLYGKPGTVQKAHIDEYMHWHHRNTRGIAALTMPQVRPELNLSFTAETEEITHKVLQSLDQAWLKDDQFIAAEHYSIADLLAYEEIAQSTMTGAVDLSGYPNVKAWTLRMEGMPFHDEAHASLKTLGSLKTNPSSSADDDKTLMMKRLGAATKEGMKEIQRAQDSYTRINA
jgi:glutathione S-transferase